MHAMDAALFLARLILASIFILAAIGQFIDLKGSQRALVGFGFPEWLGYETPTKPALSVARPIEVRLAEGD